MQQNKGGIVGVNGGCDDDDDDGGGSKSFLVCDVPRGDKMEIGTFLCSQQSDRPLCP